MLNKLTRPLAFLMLVTTAHGELAYRTSESCDENLKNLVVMVLVGVLVDWLRIKLKIPIPSTEKLGYAGEKMLVSEEETKGSINCETSFESSKQTPKEQAPENEIPAETQDEATETTKTELPSDPQEIDEVEAEENILTASLCLSTHNLEPVIAPDCAVKEEEEHISCDFEEFIANVTKPFAYTRPRFYSDPTGRDDRTGMCSLETDEDSKIIVGERTPERTPEMPSVANLSKTEEIPNLQEPGESHKLSEEWLIPEEKINERKPMVFIGGVSASTTPMEVVHELKKQEFNVTVVPRIRYGVSFGFCPDLVLSSAEEVETLLAMKKIWIKDRWIDIRPYVPKDEEAGNDTTSSVPVEIPSKPAPNTQEVNANVFADTSNFAINSPSSSSSTPNYASTVFQGSPQMPIFNGYEMSYVDMNMSPPGSLSSTPTFNPSYAIPAPMMFPIPGCFYAPQFPTEFAYPEMAHQTLTCEQPTAEQYS